MTAEYRSGEPPLSETTASNETRCPVDITANDVNNIVVFSAKDEKDARMASALERLDEGIDKLLADPAGYFRVMARFHKYSLSNQLLIWSQRPDATHVAGFRQWQEKFGRQVQKGEKGIRIFHPRFRRVEDPDTGETEQRLVGFGLSTVFDVAQTDGNPLPERPPITEEMETNHVATAVNLKLSRYLIDAGVRLESVPMEGHRGGDYTPALKRIRIRQSTMVSPLNVAKTKTLAHEAAHFLADHKGDTDRRDAETVAEASAFVAMSHFGMDTRLYSSNYIAGWAEDRERLKANLTEIRRVGGAIIGAVEGVGDPYADEFGAYENMRHDPLDEQNTTGLDMT